VATFPSYAAVLGVVKFPLSTAYRYLSLMHSYSVITENHTSPKTRFFSLLDDVGLTSTTVT